MTSWKLSTTLLFLLRYWTNKYDAQGKIEMCFLIGETLIKLFFWVTTFWENIDGFLSQLVSMVFWTYLTWIYIGSIWQNVFTPPQKKKTTLSLLWSFDLHLIFTKHPWPHWDIQQPFPDILNYTPFPNISPIVRQSRMALPQLPSSREHYWHRDELFLVWHVPHAVAGSAQSSAGFVE